MKQRMTTLWGPIISESELAQLATYKYSSYDYSLIANYILKYYWNGCVHLFPLWLAPNLITLLGLCFVLANFFLMAYYIPDLRTSAPSWVYYLFALNFWLYSTFDNVDGKQARRTNTSSPLGELFDHGCDALTIVLTSFNIMAATGCGLDNKRYMGIPIMNVVSFYICTWQTYHTRSLVLGHINGPTEGIILSCVIFCISGYYGPEVWQKSISDLNLQSIFFLTKPDTVVLDLLYFSMTLLFGCYLLPSVIGHVVYYYYQKKTFHLSQMIYSFAPILAYSGIFLAWANGSYTNVWSPIYIFYFILMFALVFGGISTKIILAYLTRASYPGFTGLLLPPLLGAILANLDPSFPQYEGLFVLASLASVLGGYLYWTLNVINELCVHLGISCLSIPYYQDKKHK